MALATPKAMPRNRIATPSICGRSGGRILFSALSLPEVGDWNREQRLALLDAATLRYRDRLVNRASRTSPETALRHVERLAAMEAPPGPAIGQTCAQFALLDGPCAEHAGYVRRVEVVEELRDTASSTVLAYRSTP